MLALGGTEASTFLEGLNDVGTSGFDRELDACPGIALNGLIV